MHFAFLFLLAASVLLSPALSPRANAGLLSGAVWVSLPPGLTINGAALPRRGLAAWPLRPGDRIRTAEVPARISLGRHGTAVLGAQSKLEVFEDAPGIGLRLLSGELEWDLRSPAALPLWAQGKRLDTRRKPQGAVAAPGNGRPLPARSRQNAEPFPVPAEPQERSLSASCEGAVQALPPRARCWDWPYGGVRPAVSGAGR